MNYEDEEPEKVLSHSVWLSVLDSAGNVIHETWHNSIRANEEEWTWENCPRAVSLEDLFYHVARIRFENPGSRVVGHLLPNFNLSLEIATGC